MEEVEKYDSSMNEEVLVQFEIVVLNQIIECQLPIKTTLKKAIMSLKKCLGEKEKMRYDFENCFVQDENRQGYFNLNDTLEEIGVTQGCHLVVI